MDTFLSREEYSQLVYGSCVSSTRGPCQSGKRVSIVKDDDTLELLPPAFVKPERWTGKQVRCLYKETCVTVGLDLDIALESAAFLFCVQVITTILNHLTKGHPPFTVEMKGKISVQYLTAKVRHVAEGEKLRDPEELVLFIRHNELLKGMIDKNQFGNHGIVHTVHELYGADTAGRLLSIFSRLFTLFLQVTLKTYFFYLFSIGGVSDW